METKIFKSINLIRCVSGANLRLFRYAAMVLVLLLGVGNAWAGGGGGSTAYYYAKVTATPNPTGAGSVYVNTSNSQGSSSSATSEKTETQNQEKTFYLYATVSYGYQWSTWTKTGSNNGTLSNATTQRGATYKGKASSSTSSSPTEYTVRGDFTRRAIEAVGNPTVTSLSSAQTWRSHANTAKVEFQDKYVLSESDITISYPSDIATVTKTKSWTKGTNTNGDGSATTNGKMTVSLGYNFSTPTSLVHNPSATMTVQEQSSLSSPSSSIDKTSSPVAIGLDLTPVFSTDKTSHTFPATEVNTSAQTTISATSYGDLPVSNAKCAWSYTLTGTNADQFGCSVSGGVATVTYHPNVAASHAASLTMTAKWTDANGTELSYSAPAITINGSATAPDFTISNLNYTTTTNVGTAEKTLTLQNVSYVTSATINFTGDNASCFSASAYNTTTKSFDITFTAPVSGGRYQAGTYTATATVTGNAAASNAVRTATLTAVVNPAPLSDFTVPNAITFNNGEDMESGTTDDQTITLTNIQNVVGTPTITIDGTDASMYAVQGGYDSENHAFTVRFTASGTKGGKLTADATVTVENYDGETVSKTVELNAFMEEVVTSDVRVTNATRGLVTECDWATAIKDYQVAGYTFTLLRHKDLGTITATNNITKAITIDLNGKTLRAAVNATSVGILNVNAAVELTIKDSRGGGKIINEIARNAEIRTITVTKGTLTLESGTLAVHNTGQYASAANADLGVTAYASCQCRTIHQAAGTTVNIIGGKVEAYGTRSVYGIFQASSAATNNAGTTVLNVSGGEIYAEGPYSIMGIYAYGKVNFSGGTINAHVTTNMIDARYAADNANNLYNGYGYGIYATVSSSATASSCYYATVEMTGGTINVTNDRSYSVDRRNYGILFNAASTVVASGQTGADGTLTQKASATGSIDGGEINVTSGTQYSFGVYVLGDYNSYNNTHHTVQIKNCKITSKAYVYAYGVAAWAGFNGTNNGCYAGNVELTNCDVYAESLNTSTAAAVWVNATGGTLFQDDANATKSRCYGEYAVAGKAVINSGKYEAKTKTTTAYAAGTATRYKTTYGSETTVQANRKQGGHAEAYPVLIIHGGTFKCTTTTTSAYCISNGGYTTIDGGEFEAYSTGRYAYGFYSLAGKLAASGAKVTANATQDAYGAYANVSIPTNNTVQTGFAYAGELELNNCDITATTRTSTEARGVFVNATNKLHTWAQFKADSTSYKWATTTYDAYKSVFPCTIEGRDSVGVAIVGKATINGCNIKATAHHNTAYGVYAVCSYDAKLDSIATPKLTVRNTKMVVKTDSTTTATGISTQGETIVDGCDITVQPKTTTGYGIITMAPNDEKVTVSNTKITVTTTNSDNTKSAAAYGLYGNIDINATHGLDRHGNFVLNDGNEVNVSTTSGTTAYAVYLSATKRAITTTGGAYRPGNYANAATAIINGGKYTAYAAGGTCYALGVADPQIQGDVTSTPSMIVNGGKFKGTAGATPYADVSVTGEPGYFVLNGGYYVKDENLDKKLGEEMNKVAVKSGTPEYTEGYRWHVTDGMTGEAVCKITQNSTSYASLEEALQVVNASPSSTWTIVMTANYTLSKGDYEIPANTTLLIPYKSDQTTANGKTPAWVNKNASPAPTTPVPYRKLTFASGVNITVKGKIEASSTTYINQSAWTGIVGGPFGWLYLNEGSHIDLESGAYLFAWGYVTGKGEINAKNGSYIYEDFQMGDWRGGTISSGIQGNTNGLGSKGVFLLTDYYFQNVECPITYRPGANSVAYSGTYLEKSVFGMTIQDNAKSDPVKMVGTSDAMFLMNTATAGADTWVRKEYDVETDQLVWTLNSGASIGSFQFKIDGTYVDVDLNTANYVLPMATNFKIIANEGDINITNDVVFLPGSEAIVKKEANLVVAEGKRVFIYDTDDWTSYGGYFRKIGYSPSWKVCPRMAATSTKLADAKIEVAGTVDVRGAIYTTSGGGNLFSTRENAGKVKFTAAAPASTSAIAQFTGNNGKDKTLCQVVNYADDKVQYVGKALTSFKLKNEDGEYTPTTGTAAGDIYAYMEDPADGVYRWLSVKDNGCFTEIKGADTKQYIHPSDFVAVEANANGDHAYHNEGSTRYFVNAEKASTNASCVWWEAEPKGVIDGVTYYMANNENFDNYGTYFYWDNSVSYWKPKKITVTWKDKDGNKITNGSFGDSYSFNTSPQFFGTNPTWANTSTEKHDWIGWRDEDGNIYDKNATLPVATGDVTYIAYFQTSKYQYTVTFKNETDNKVIWAGLLDAGDPAVCPVEPTQESTASTIYTFTNWVGYAEGDDLPVVTGPATYTAHYTARTRQYHVTFYNYDAVTVLLELDVDYNTRPVYNGVGVTPFRANTSAFSYDWTGWQQGTTHYGTTDNLALVTGDVYYVATFSQTDLKYQVLFKRQDGSIIDAPFFSYEETPTAFPANPTLASTVSTDYTFDHWDPATLQPVTMDGMVYTAYFNGATRQYTAHFVNYDGASLGVDQTIDYNTVPAYTGATPFKPNDSRNSYEFAGWAWEAGAGWEAGSIGVGEEFPAIKGDITFTAQFNPVLLQFNVLYVREDGTILLQDKKKWGENTAFPSSVASYEDDTYTYTFDHWSPATVVNPVTTDVTYTAYFSQAIKTYSITTIAISPEGNGTVSPTSVTEIPSGSVVTVNGNKITVNGQTVTATPTAADAQYTYAFDHWNNVPATVTGNVSNIEAVFTRTVNTYTVTWKNGDVTLETDENVAYGATPHYDGATPTKATTAEYTYTFAGWDNTPVAVTGEATYKATFSSSKNSYEITWLNDDNSLIEKTTVEYGVVPTHADATKENTAEYTYTFTGWDNTPVAVTGDATYKATFSSSKNSYEITWLNDDNSLIEKTTVEYGVVPTHADATKENTAEYTYTFTGWDNTPVAVTGDATYKATFSSSKNSYEITWLNDDNSLIEKTTVEYGVVPTHADATKAATDRYTYTFIGWSPEVVAVEDVATYTAQFEESEREYIITWQNPNNEPLVTTKNYFGGTPAYPTHEYHKLTYTDEENHLYRFIGWDPEIHEITNEENVYTAQYERIDNLVVATEESINMNTTVTTTTVHVEGKLNIASEKILTTDDLILEGTPSSSGEIIGNVNAKQHAYFHFSQPGGFKAKTWYAVAVPWLVDVSANTVGGVYLKKGEGSYVQQKLGKTYDLIYYDGARRAAGANKAWNYVEDDPAVEQIMKPGRAYMIYLISDADTIRFERKENAPLLTNSLSVYEYESSNPKNASWNGIANPATYHAYINASVKDYSTGTINVGQVYNAETKTYSVVDMDAKNLVVGQPIFVQATATNESVIAYASHDDAFHAAPRRAKEWSTPLTRFEVELASNDEIVSDRIIIRMNEDKEKNEYMVGQDLVKMGVSSLVPQMWIDRYDSKMCINTVAPINNTADYPLSLFVPQAGEYTIRVAEENENADMLYLTRDDRIIWNLGYAPYTVTLERGTTDRYGLKLVHRIPEVATDIESMEAGSENSVQKILLNDKVYILRGGEMYSIDGQLVK